MSREIKFRAWDTRREMMIENVYFFELNHNSDMEINPAERTKYRLYDGWRSLEDGSWKPCELMQFTGLKDKNGTDIYEGDIIKLLNDAYIYPVKWEQKYAQFTAGPWEFGVEINPSFEIIGNIHQNSELL